MIIRTIGRLVTWSLLAAVTVIAWWVILLLLALLWPSTGRAADSIAPIRWQIETSRPARMDLELIRGETVILEPQYLSYGEPLTLTNTYEVVLRYRDASMASGQYYAAAGSVLSATDGVVQIVWAPTNEAAASRYAYTIAAESTAGDTLRGFGSIALLGSVSGSATNTPRVMTDIDWSGVVHHNLGSAPFVSDATAEALASNIVVEATERRVSDQALSNAVAAIEGDITNLVSAAELLLYLTSASAGRTYQPTGTYATVASLLPFLTAAQAGTQYQPTGTYVAVELDTQALAEIATETNRAIQAEAQLLRKTSTNGWQVGAHLAWLTAEQDLAALAAMTNLPATALTSGTVPLVRLSGITSAQLSGAESQSLARASMAVTNGQRLTTLYLGTNGASVTATGTGPIDLTSLGGGSTANLIGWTNVEATVTGAAGKIPTSAAVSSALAARDVARLLTNSVTVTVGPDGEYPTMSAALAYLSQFRPALANPPISGTVELTDLYTNHADQVYLSDQDLSWVEITQTHTNPVVVDSIVAWEWDGGEAALFSGYRSRLPVIAALFVCTPWMMPNSSHSYRHGVNISENSSVAFSLDGGFVGFDNGVMAENGCTVFAAQATLAGMTPDGAGYGAGISVVGGCQVVADSMNTWSNAFGVQAGAGCTISYNGPNNSPQRDSGFGNDAEVTMGGIVNTDQGLQLNQTANTLTENGIIFAQ